jgi:hypothetical protein
LERKNNLINKGVTMNPTETIATALTSPIFLILITCVAGIFIAHSRQQQKEIDELRKKLGKDLG